MGRRDGIYSYVHMDDPNRALYIERWRDDPLPYDAIDTDALRSATATLFPARLFEDDEDEIGLSMNAATIGFKNARNRRTLCEPPWTDTNILDKFRDEHLALHQIRDPTLLGSLHDNIYDSDQTGQATIALFLASGMAPRDHPPHEDALNDSMSRSANVDLSINSELNNTFSLLRAASSVHTALLQVPSSSASLHPNQTPRSVRRASSERVFETPIARIIR